MLVCGNDSFRLYPGSGFMKVLVLVVKGRELFEGRR
jgi:hypothetical protein